MTVLRLARFRAVRPAAYRTAHRPLALFAVVLLALGWPALHGDEKKETKLPDQVSYSRDVRPIFQQHCQGCHQPAKAEGGFLMTSHADLFKKGDNDEPGVVVGSTAKS